MATLKCCVGGCNATTETHRLFSFPKNDDLRNLWMSFLVPTNSDLIVLSKEQLLRKRVCEKHFDRYQFDHEGKRLRHSYPCLFSENEIAHGVPLATGLNVASDHNYFQKQDDDVVPESSVVVERAGWFTNDHKYSKEQSEDDVSKPLLVMESEKHAGLGSFREQPSCSHFPTVAPGIKNTDDSVVLELPSSSFTKSMEPHVSAELTGIYSNAEVVRPLISEDGKCHMQKQRGMKRPLISEDGKCRTQKQKASTLKKFGSKKRKLMKDMINIGTESLGQSASQRLAQAQSLAANRELLDNFNLLNKHAQAFLLMQLKQARKGKMARRYTLDEKLIALLLMKQSPKGYRLLESMFALPNKRTLNRLSEKISMEPGLNPQIFNHISNKTKNWNEKQKLCTIVFDEVSLTPHLTFNEKKDIIHGFVDVAGERKMKYCDQALVFMLRGICSSWRQTVAYYFCEGTVSAAHLKNILKQLVCQVGQTGLIPLGLVCDQGSTFRTALRSFREETIRARNIQGVRDDGSINIAGHDLSIFFDPPHLLKGIRNNFLTKNINWEGKIASWKDIEFIHDLDSKLGHTRALPKLTAHHVDPKKIKKMKVSVAAQVLSSRTAAMLKYTNALNNLHAANTENTMATTAEVVEFFDTLFDSVNGSPGGTRRGKLRRAVKKNSQHHTFWTDAIKKLKMMNFVDSDSKLALKAGKPRLVRVPSLQSWIATLESFIRVSKLLFDKYGVEYYYPRNINQDPLENFFGRIRALNYRNVNPDANTFIYAFKSLVLTNVLSPHSKFANCEADDGDTLLDMSFLFEHKNSNKENLIHNTTTALPSASQEAKSEKFEKLTEQVIMEKIKVQCSAYTAGYIARKIFKIINCKCCLQTYTSSTEENIHAYIKFREYKSLKNNNLVYPSEKFLMIYRDGSQITHNYLNMHCFTNAVGSNIKKEILSTMRLAWLGCDKHKIAVKSIFIKLLIRLQVHNWCNTINKIMKGDITEKYVSNMGEPHKIALRKYISFRLRKKCLKK